VDPFPLSRRHLEQPKIKYKKTGDRHMKTTKLAIAALAIVAALLLAACENEGPADA
jgi:hypothetical protein